MLIDALEDLYIEDLEDLVVTIYSVSVRLVGTQEVNLAIVDNDGTSVVCEGACIILFYSAA